MLALLAQPERYQAGWVNTDPRWYSDLIAGLRSDSGIVTTPDKAIQISVVFRAINVLAHAVASIPLVIYRRLDDDGKERAREHPGYDMLHDKPNAWMTSFRWRHLVMVQKILYGNHYSEIYPGRAGIGQLVPLSPSTTRVVDQLGDGRLVYVTRDITKAGFGPERRLLQDELLHVRGFSMDGKAGIPLPQVAKNAMGLALSAEKHGSMFLKKGARFAGVLTAKGRMDEETRKANEAAWQRAYGGTDGTGGTPILSGDLTFTPNSANNKDSQWLESRTFQVEELLRFLGVPGVLCGYADKTATYASAEQFFLSFVTHTVRPETESFAQELNASVVTGSPEYFADFILEGLLRGDIRTRYAAHDLAIKAGFKTRNEARVEENYNKGPAELDEFDLTGGKPQGNLDAEPFPSRRDRDRSGEETQAKFAAVARRSAERLVRKEINAIAGTPGKLGAAKRFAGNVDGWKAWLAEFYDGHAAAIANDLCIPEASARRYCDDRKALLAGGLSDIEFDKPDALLALMEN